MEVLYTIIESPFPKASIAITVTRFSSNLSFPLMSARTESWSVNFTLQLSNPVHLGNCFAFVSWHHAPFRTFSSSESHTRNLKVCSFDYFQFQQGHFDGSERVVLFELFSEASSFRWFCCLVSSSMTKVTRILQVGRKSTLPQLRCFILIRFFASIAAGMVEGSAAKK